jgi:hypothetical protein
VIIADYGIKEQESWESIQMKSASIHKFAADTQSKSNIDLSASFNELHTQIQARDDARVDLARQMGDLTLYSIVLTKISNGRR